MELGIIGLGRMGGNMARRLLERGHNPMVYDLDPDKVKATEGFGAKGYASVRDLVSALKPPRAVWVMVPAGAPTHSTILDLIEVMSADDIIIDGGNSHYRNAPEHAADASKRGIHFLDAGTSGGVWGLKEGYCIMVGGPREAFQRIEPILEALAPESGYAYVGSSGAGHFVKMVHNGIEYGFLQSMAEGFELMDKAEFGLDLRQVADLWRHGSVVRSWLLDLAADALAKDKDDGLPELEPYVRDSGEARWMIEAALECAVPLPAISAALFARFASRDDNSFAMRFVAALRNEFGGHPVKKKDDTQNS